jgi:hypothetical protein
VLKISLFSKASRGILRPTQPKRIPRPLTPIVNYPHRVSHYWPPSFSFYYGVTAVFGPRPPHTWGFEITHKHTTLLELLWTSDQPDAETSTWQHTTLTTDRHPCLPAGFEPTIPASERPQNYALDRAATRLGTEPHHLALRIRMRSSTPTKSYAFIKQRDSFGASSRSTGGITRNASPAWTIVCGSNRKMTPSPVMTHIAMTTCHCIVHPCCWGGLQYHECLGLLDRG